jgi:hypothetical protein
MLSCIRSVELDKRKQFLESKGAVMRYLNKKAWMRMRRRRRRLVRILKNKTNRRS